MIRKFYYLLLFLGLNMFGQNFLEPTLKKSFGNNHHTNRDQSNFIQTDSDNNIIMTGMTERDSTFTDILITKLNPDLTLLWKKRLSFQTDLSYDVPMITALDANNNIYVTGNSRGQNSGKLFAVKIEPDGNESWRIVLENTDNPTNPYFASPFSTVDSDGTMQLSYGMVNISNDDMVYYFNTISPSGNITSQYTVSGLVDTFNNDFTGLYVKFYYHNNAFYLKYRRLNLTTTTVPYTNEHFIKKITPTGVTTFALNPYIDYTNTENFGDGTLDFDAQDNIYLSYEANNTTSYKVLKLDGSGNLLYNVSSPLGFNTGIGLTYVNAADNLCVLHNSSLIGSGIDNLVLREYDGSGNIGNEITVPGTYGEKFKRLPDGSIITQKNTGRFQLWNANLQLLNNFPFPTATTNDFCRLSDSEIIVAETTYAKMFPESDYVSQLDMLTEKITPNAVASNYTYSGEGTSKIAGDQLMADHADNYIVAYHEKMGEDFFSISGNIAPTVKGFIKYDSQLNILWTLEVPYNIVRPYNYTYPNFVFDDQNNLFLFARTDIAGEFKLLKISAEGTILFDVTCPVSEQIYLDQNNNVCLAIREPATFTNGTQISTYDAVSGTFLGVDSFPEVSLLRSYRSASGDSYVYLVSPSSSNSNAEKKVYIYKNLSLQFIQPLGIFGATNGIGGHDIDENGTLYFSSSYGQVFKFHKLTLTGDYSTVLMQEEIIRFQLTFDHKFLGFNNAGNLKIYNNDFSLFASSTQTYSPTDVYTAGNYILLHTYYDKTIMALDNNAQLAATFKIPSRLWESSMTTDAQGRLVLSGVEGVQINFQPEYAWYRGFIHKYDIEATVLQNNEFDNPATSNIKAYPNPATTQITVSVSEKELKKVEIFDLAGRLITTSKNDTIDISELVPALYILKIENSNGLITVKKILKK